VTEYDRRPSWIAVFFKGNDGAVMKFNDVFSMHASADSFSAVVLQGLDL
jgi:hypothetical protein